MCWCGKLLEFSRVWFYIYIYIYIKAKASRRCYHVRKKGHLKCCHVYDFELKGLHVASFTIYSLKYHTVHRLERHTFIKHVSIKTKTHLSKKEKKHKPKILNVVFPIAHSNFRFSSFRFSLFHFLLKFLNTYACDTEMRRQFVRSVITSIFLPPSVPLPELYHWNQHR